MNYPLQATVTDYSVTVALTREIKIFTMLQLGLFTVVFVPLPSFCPKNLIFFPIFYLSQPLLPSVMPPPQTFHENYETQLVNELCICIFPLSDQPNSQWAPV